MMDRRFYEKLLTKVTDPRGLATQIQYYENYVQIAPYGALTSGVVTTAIVAPNGDATALFFSGDQMWQQVLNGLGVGPSSTVVVELNSGLSGDLKDNGMSMMFASGSTTTSGYQTQEHLISAIWAGRWFSIPPTAQPGQGDGYTVTKDYDPFQESCLTTDTTISRASDGYWHYDQTVPFDDDAETITPTLITS